MTSALPQSYQDLLEAAADAGRPPRAGEFAAAAGLGTEKAKVESLRSKLNWPRSRRPAARSTPRTLRSPGAAARSSAGGRSSSPSCIPPRTIPAFYAARVPEPCTPGTLLILSADCKGVVMRPEALRAATAKAAAKLGKMRTRLAAGEKPNRKRMAALVTVYDATPTQRRPHDVIAPPGGRHGTRPLRPGPKARGSGHAERVVDCLSRPATQASRSAWKFQCGLSARSPAILPFSCMPSQHKYPAASPRRTPRARHLDG